MTNVLQEQHEICLNYTKPLRFMGTEPLNTHQELCFVDPRYTALAIGV